MPTGILFPETKWLSDCSNVVLQQSLRNLDSAFSAFFRKKAKYPNFKSKHKSRNSAKFIANVHFDFEKWAVKLPNIGWVTLCKNRDWNQATCKQGTTTVSMDKCGTFWVTVVVDNLKGKPQRREIQESTAVGIDLGIKDYAVLSDGTKYGNPKHLTASQKTLSRFQRSFSRTKKGSKRHERARLVVARQFRKISNQRLDYINKLTTDIVRHYDTICLEDLNVEGMMKNSRLARAIGDAAWSEFVRQIKYKTEWLGKNVIFIGRFDPSSQLCSCCGYRNQEVKELSIRQWVCPQCGTPHDRDVNAAINIKHIGLQLQYR